MKKNTILTLFIAISILSTSCYNTKIYVGEVGKKEAVIEVQKEWNHHFLYGLIPAKNAKMATKDFLPDEKNYVVKTNQGFVNMLVGFLTFGIYTPTQTTYYVPVKSLKKQE